MVKGSSFRRLVRIKRYLTITVAYISIDQNPGGMASLNCAHAGTRKCRGYMKSSGLRVKSATKAGALSVNHSKAALKVKSGAKAGALSVNHSKPLLGFSVNHSRALLSA